MTTPLFIIVCRKKVLLLDNSETAELFDLKFSIPGYH